MSKPSITKLLAAAVTSLWLAIPAPVLAAVNPDAQSAAAAGIQYLANNQKADGSINGFGGESEWSVEAIQAGGQKASDFIHGGASLLDFLKTDVPPAGTPTTTLERKIIAISAAGQDPANFGGVDYEALLSAQHLSGQIGDATLLNDDIFGIIAIDAAHDTSLLPEAQDGLNYLLAHQAADGGFSYTTASCAFCGSDNNDTAAALVAMYAAADLGLSPANLDTAKTNALNYIFSTQQPDGGFAYDAFSPSDGSSTAWSLMALNTVGSFAATSATSARTWLLNNQNADGGFSYGAFGITSSDTYTTAHAVIALLGTSWLMRPAPLAAPSASSGQTAGAGSGSSQPQAQPQTGPQTVAASSTSTTPASDQAGDGSTADSTPSDTPQVKAANIIKSNHIGGSRSKTKPAGKTRLSYGAYAVAFLGLAAVIWFVLESRKATGV